LQKLEYTPFEYGMRVLSVYDDGVMLNPEIVAMTTKDYVSKF